MRLATQVRSNLFGVVYVLDEPSAGLHPADTEALLAALARLAVERGCGRVEWAVLDWNKPSIRFYDSLGAGPIAGWIPYRLTGDALKALAAESSGS